VARKNAFDADSSPSILFMVCTLPWFVSLALDGVSAQAAAQTSAARMLIVAFIRFLPPMFASVFMSVSLSPLGF
jgi:hypothetical protein